MQIASTPEHLAPCVPGARASRIAGPGTLVPLSASMWGDVDGIVSTTESLPSCHHDAERVRSITGDGAADHLQMLAQRDTGSPYQW